MEEVLSNPADAKKPLHEQVFYGLRLFDSPDNCGLGF